MPNDTSVTAGGGIGNAVPMRQQIRLVQAGVPSSQGIGMAGASVFIIAADAASTFMSISMAMGQGCGAVCAKADTQDAPTNVSSSRARRTVRNVKERMVLFYGSSRQAQGTCVSLTLRPASQPSGASALAAAAVAVEPGDADRAVACWRFIRPNSGTPTATLSALRMSCRRWWSAAQSAGACRLPHGRTGAA